MCELLAPAGSYESMIAAVNAGADAVYVGGRMFGARAYADNPDKERLLRGLDYCHIHGRKLYLTVNTLLKERELTDMLYPYLLPYWENGVDGLIVQDLGVMRFVQEHFPGLPIHASTQMTVTGPEGARLLKAQGVSRVVPARELSLEEIRAIIEEAGVEVETFVHGAMCYSYSGQCLFSSLLGGRSGNRGRCAQPCRLPYRVEDASAAYLLSMKDMCTLDLLPEILDAGIASLKIEGRMKRPEYTAGVVSIYRKYIDLYQRSGKENYRVEDEDRSVLLDLYNRGGFSEGYYHTRNGREMLSLYRPNHRGRAAVRLRAGKGKNPRFTAIEPLGKGDVIELAPGREVTLGEDIKRAETFRLPGRVSEYPADGVFYRTKNARLLEQLKTQYMDREIQESVSGTLAISADAPAVLTLTCREIRVSCSLAIAEPAKSRPTDADTVLRQMKKTGNTPFVFETLDLSLADGLFVPVAKLNELRRAGLSMLEEALLEKGRRKPAAGQDTDFGQEIQVGQGTQVGQRACTGQDMQGGQETCETQRTDVKQKASGFLINILVTTEEQLEAVLECERTDIDTVYLDALIFATAGERSLQLVGRVKRRGWRCFLNCPVVLRSRERAFLSGNMMRTVMKDLDGFLLHTVDELAFFRDFIRETGISAILAADDNFYAYNSRAAKLLQELGIGRFTLPAELNFRELMSLDTGRAELNVYGFQALMQSAQCVKKNTDRCVETPGITYLTDRRKVRFPILNRCPFCCNTIYNSVPLMLCGCHAELARLSPAFLRLSFTVESKAETARVIDVCMGVLNKGAEPSLLGETTRGHFKRGVE